MADKNWQAGSKNLILASIVICFAAVVLPCGPALALSDNFTPASYVGSLDPNVLWEILIGVVVVAAFIGAVALWVHSALRKVKRSQVRRTAYISSALNSLTHGVVMTDPKQRIVYCNDRYLEIYGLQRSDLPPGMTGRELLAMRRARGTLDCSIEEFYARSKSPEGLITELPNGRSILVRYFGLPNGGSVATHEDSTDQRKLSRELSSTKQFLESVLDNVPGCVAAKNIVAGRYIFANKAFERFSRFSRDHIVGRRADEIFQPETAANIEASCWSSAAARSGCWRPTASSRATKPAGPSS